MNGFQNRETLANEIRKACDILRRDNNCGGVMEYVEHLSWLLFLRFLDAQEEEWETQARLAGRNYEPIIEPPYRWKDWATKDWDAEDLLTFIHSKLISYLRSISGSPIRDVIKGVFSERNVIVCASGYNLKEVISIINEINFHNQDDIFTVSQIYEELLRSLGKENKIAGEFYTPRPVIRFMVEIVDPKIGETIYDPACGTCGFLIQAYLWMRKQEKTIDDYETLQKKTFFGQEKKPIPALLGLMNMVLHGITMPNVIRANTLEENIRQVSQRYDVILTNPPFGGKEGRHIQQNFPIRSQATELLFLQHIMKKLNLPPKNSRCGMVVPEGTLFRGGAFAEVKKQLLEEFNLHTVISLPPGVFAPYSDVKTALIFFERPGPTKEIWYYELPLPNGLQKFTKTNPINDEHFEEARKLWKAWNEYRLNKGSVKECLSSNSWIVSIDEIKEREYDLSAKNPNRKEDDSLPNPFQIATTLLEREREITNLLEEIESILGSEREENDGQRTL